MTFDEVFGLVGTILLIWFILKVSRGSGARDMSDLGGYR